MRTSTYVQHSCTVHEHRLQVPLDHSDPTGATIDLFARQIIRPGGEDLPHLLFLQGGPGGEGPRPGDFRDGWIGRALQDHRVVLMDQRGTGQSSRLDWQALSQLPDDAARARHLRHFLQAGIIGDCEILRQEIAGGAQWTTLGQSYGGFLTVAYLSAHPESLRECLITGGLPPLTHVDQDYRLTYPLTAARNRAYLERHPDDEAVIRQIAAHLRDSDETLPTGERLSPTRFRMVGMALGTQTGFDSLHYLLESPFTSVNGERRLTTRFLADVAGRVSMNPMYAVLQEAIYAGATPGLEGTSTNWSAQRLAAEFPGFQLDADPMDTSEPWHLTGEHMFCDVFREDPALAPLEGTTDQLAQATDFQPVYLPQVLHDNLVPVAAAVYYDDMFVPREHSLRTAQQIGGCRTWVTSEYQHDGVRASAGRVFDHLRDLVRD